MTSLFDPHKHTEWPWGGCSLTSAVLYVHVCKGQSAFLGWKDQPSCIWGGGALRGEGGGGHLSFHSGGRFCLTSASWFLSLSRGSCAIVSFCKSWINKVSNVERLICCVLIWCQMGQIPIQDWISLSVLLTASVKPSLSFLSSGVFYLLWPPPTSLREKEAFLSFMMSVQFVYNKSDLYLMCSRWRFVKSCLDRNLSSTWSYFISFKNNHHFMNSGSTTLTLKLIKSH